MKLGGKYHDAKLNSFSLRVLWHSKLQIFKQKIELEINKLINEG